MQIAYTHIWLQGSVVALWLALSPQSKKALTLIPFDSLESGWFLPNDTLFSQTRDLKLCRISVNMRVGEFPTCVL